MNNTVCLVTKKKFKKYSDNWFRSSDPGVMSPVRFLCAMSLFIIFKYLKSFKTYMIKLSF